MDIYLASRSPRRAELLSQIGVHFSIVDVDVDESVAQGEPAPDYVRRLAIAKARAGWQAQSARGGPMLPVLGSDTAVVAGQQILGKPRDRQHYFSMLRQLSGQCHQVMTAVSLIWEDTVLSALNTTQVQFRDLAEQEIADYWDSGEPLGKAGGYAIQGFAAVFIRRIEGSYSAVMGLPLAETYDLLRMMEPVIARN